jgi:predicted transcriptional regulator
MAAAKFAAKAAKDALAEASLRNDPEHILALTVGNSVEKIAELEEDYDFSDVPVMEQEEAKCQDLQRKPFEVVDWRGE